MIRRARLFAVFTLVLAAVVSPIANTAYATSDDSLDLYKKADRSTGVHWSYLAAFERYETSIRWRLARKNSAAAYEWPAQQWCGLLNPNQNDRMEGTISLFGGIGKDGDRDGIADPTNNADWLYAAGGYLSRYGKSEQDIRRILFERYQDSIIVDRVTGFANVFKENKSTALEERAFPISKRFDYTYRNTWGDRRGWGGRRIHEGTDIFVGYGTPVLSTCYGFIELKGWNEYGGWRIGIRDVHNVYHYFGHLSGFKKGIKMGSVVKPGQVIGFVGSSGYGRPGTSGKFPPHLHFGMYRDTGTSEWAFDPYPYLRRWEAQRK